MLKYYFIVIELYKHIRGACSILKRRGITLGSLNPIAMAGGGDDGEVLCQKKLGLKFWGIFRLEIIFIIYSLHQWRAQEAGGGGVG